MEKQGAYVQNWKKRYFILRKGSLSYFARPEDEAPKGIISLVRVKVFSMLDFKKQFPHYSSPSTPLVNFGGHTVKENILDKDGLVIRTTNRNYFILCNSTRERDEWIQGIKNCVL